MLLVQAWYFNNFHPPASGGPSYIFTVKFMYLCIREKIGLLISRLREVGKSGHHRAAKRITSVTREGRTSATESKYSSAVVKPGKLFAVQW